MKSSIQQIPSFTTNRRKFIVNTSKIIGTGLMLASPLVSAASNILELAEPVTVGQIMDLFISEVPGGAKANTVDTLKSGNRDIKVTGIVTSMFATIEVIRQAIAMNANFIIAHEPTFYNHADETGWLENDDVYQYKSSLLKQHNIAVWRNHDYVHSLITDGVRKGVVEQLGWQNFGSANQNLYQLKPTPTLTELISHVKQKLNIKMLRYIGNPAQVCQKVLLMPGASGGRNQISAMIKNKPDVLVCGEISEWESAEYVRDANAKGNKLALIVLGHIASEEPGSEFMAKWMKEKFPAIKTTHLPAGNSLSFL
jgi:putative NIF3 family GTP cyclohydrolase 1 type 2